MKLTVSLMIVLAALVATASKSPAASPSHRCRSAREGLTFYTASTRRWESQHDATLTPPPRPTRSCARIRAEARLAQHQSRRARTQFEIWLRDIYAKWACIHRHESGNWHIHNPPYDGGMQMDSGFQKTYGSEFIARWGSAGNWPVWAQLLASERAFHGYQSPYKDAYVKGRGFSPWPNTRISCGL